MLAIIGGTGLSQLDFLGQADQRPVQTPYGSSEVLVSLFQVAGRQLAFLPRHLSDHSLPPHKINYRANIWALKQLGVTDIVSVNAVGAIHPQLAPGNLAIPHQLIDYSWGRDASFFEDELQQVTHIDFTFPYTEALRQRLLHCINAVNSSSDTARYVLASGVYGCTQGPRLETAAEIRRLEQDGCDMVGMTGMPEAALARELEIDYASLAVSVNWAAGFSDELISLEEIHSVLQQAMGFVAQLLQQLASEKD